jgi:hypothetical protein
MEFERSSKRWANICFLVTGIMIAFWAAWFGHRSLVASSNSDVYIGFENSFPAPDAWLTLCLLGAGISLRKRKSLALLWLLLAAGAGGYLFFIDVAFDLEHGIWTSGAGGLIELGINLLTVTLTAAIIRWTWRNRLELQGLKQLED